MADEGHERHCVHCGQPVSSQASYCARCGTRAASRTRSGRFVQAVAVAGVLYAVTLVWVVGNCFLCRGLGTPNYERHFPGLPVSAVAQDYVRGAFDVLIGLAIVAAAAWLLRAAWSPGAPPRARGQMTRDGGGQAPP